MKDNSNTTPLSLPRTNSKITIINNNQTPVSLPGTVKQSNRYDNSPTVERINQNITF